MIAVMHRRADWVDCLFAWYHKRRAQPFAWGVNDCVTFAFDGIEAMTETDLAADFRGTYTTPAGALRVLLKLGSSSLEHFIDVRLGTRAPVVQLRRGDVGLYRAELDGWPFGVAIVLGEWAASPGPECVRHVPTLDAVAGWRI